MAEWQSMDIAPLDGTPIKAEIPGHGQDNIIAWLDIDQDSSGWHYGNDDPPPASWTDGVCWAVNDDGEQSVLPTRWKEIVSETPDRSEN